MIVNEGDELKLKSSHEGNSNFKFVFGIIKCRAVGKDATGTAACSSKFHGQYFFGALRAKISSHVAPRNRDIGRSARGFFFYH